MSRPALEVADIFRGHGPAWRQANAGHVSLDQLKVMSAIESCRTAALGGHVARCEDCAYTPSLTTPAATGTARSARAQRQSSGWPSARPSCLPVPYFHVVFTLPAAIADIAYQNKAVIYDLLFKASAETLITIAADPKHLGARIGITSVLHTWGSALTHHPHVHMIVPGGGISLDGTALGVVPAGLLPAGARALAPVPPTVPGEAPRGTRSRPPQFFGNHAPLADAQAFAAYLAPLRKTEWVVYSKRPFGGPEAVLAYLSRYTHRVAISNSRLIAFDRKASPSSGRTTAIEGRDRYKLMTLATDEFIRRFLIHVLPKGFHRIRHYGLLRQGGRRRQHRARPRTARRAKAPKRTCRDRCRRSQPAGMSMLRRPHDHHRDIRARRDAAPSANRSRSIRIDTS